MPVQDDDVVELKPLGPVRTREQQSALGASEVAAPFMQPFVEGGARHSLQVPFFVAPYLDGFAHETTPAVGACSLGLGDHSLHREMRLAVFA